MAASSRSAMPISSCRALAEMMRAGSSGFSWNATIASVTRAHRAHQDEIEAGEDEEGGDQRHDEAGDDHALGIGDEIGADRLLRQDDADGILALDVGRRDDVQDAVAAVEQAIERVEHVGARHGMDEIDGGVDGLGLAVDLEELAHVGAGEQDLHRAGALEQDLADVPRQAVAARLGEGQHGQLGALDMVVQKIPVVASDRGHEDQDFGHHHVDDGQKQQAAGKAMGDKPIGVGQTGAGSSLAWPHKARRTGQILARAAAGPPGPARLTAPGRDNRNRALSTSAPRSP